REAHEAAQTPARPLIGKGFIADDRARPVEHECRAQLRLPAVAAIDRKADRTAWRVRQPHGHRLPVALLLRRPLQEAVEPLDGHTRRPRAAATAAVARSALTRSAATASGGRR